MAESASEWLFWLVILKMIDQSQNFVYRADTFIWFFSSLHIFLLAKQFRCAQFRKKLTASLFAIIAQFQGLRMIKISNIFFKLRELFLFLSYNVYKEQMFIIEMGAKRPENVV